MWPRRRSSCLVSEVSAVQASRDLPPSSTLLEDAGTDVSRGRGPGPLVGCRPSRILASCGGETEFARSGLGFDGGAVLGNRADHTSLGCRMSQEDRIL